MWAKVRKLKQNIWLLFGGEKSIIVNNTFDGFGGIKMDPIDKWLSLEEIADYLGVTKDTIRNWIKKTDIPAHKIGRLWKFKLSEVDEWVKSGKSAL